MKSVLEDNRPIFLQIKEGIEDDILSGVLKPDEQIPSNSQLVGFYGINPVTVLRGVGLLADEGVVYKKRGVGMFVSPDAPDILRTRFRKVFEAEQVPALVRLAGSLGIRPEELHAMIDALWNGED